jgi:hypothetical protein
MGRENGAVPTFQFMTKRDEVWSEVEATWCERAGDVITLVEMIDHDGHRVERFTVEIHDVVELPDY